MGEKRFSRAEMTIQDAAINSAFSIFGSGSTKKAAAPVARKWKAGEMAKRFSREEMTKYDANINSAFFGFGSEPDVEEEEEVTPKKSGKKSGKKSDKKAVKKSEKKSTNKSAKKTSASAPKWKSTEDFAKRFSREHMVKHDAVINAAFFGFASAAADDDEEQEIPNTGSGKSSDPGKPRWSSKEEMAYQFSREAYAENDMTIGGLIKGLFGIKSQKKSNNKTKMEKYKEKLLASIETKWSSPEEMAHRFSREYYAQHDFTIGGMIKGMFGFKSSPPSTDYSSYKKPAAKAAPPPPPAPKAADKKQTGHRIGKHFRGGGEGVTISGAIKGLFGKLTGSSKSAPAPVKSDKAGASKWNKMTKNKFNKHDVTVSGAIASMFRKILGRPEPVVELDEDAYTYDFRFDTEKGEKPWDGAPKSSQKKSKNVLRKSKFNREDVTFKSLLGFRSVYADADYDYDYGIARHKSIVSGETAAESEDLQDIPDNMEVKTRWKSAAEMAKRFSREAYAKREATISGTIKGLFGFGRQVEEDEEDEEEESGLIEEPEEEEKVEDTKPAHQLSKGAREMAIKFSRETYAKNDLTIKGLFKGLFGFGSKPGVDSKKKKETKPAAKLGKKDKKKVKEAKQEEPKEKQRSNGAEEMAKRFSREAYAKNDVTIKGFFKNLFGLSTPEIKSEPEEEKPKKKKKKQAAAAPVEEAGDDSKQEKKGKA